MLIQSVIPQWAAPTSSPQSSAPQTSPLMAFYISPPRTAQTMPGANTADLLCGIAYPGQQHFVQIQGEAVHYTYRTETLTFHNPDLVYDPTQQHGQIVWKSPQIQTTPSGITVTILNARPNLPVLSARDSLSGSVLLCLAWHLPKDTVWSGQASARSYMKASAHPYMDVVQLQPLTVQTIPVDIIFESTNFIQGTDWGKLRLPGEPLSIPKPPMLPDQRHTDHRSQPRPPFYALIRSGYEAQVLSMQSSELPNTGHSQHLSTLTLIFRTRILQKRVPFQLTVPVQKQQ